MMGALLTILMSGIIKLSIKSPQDLMKVWNDVKKGIKVILCDGLKESNLTTAKFRKQSKKKNDSDSDSDEDVTVTSGRSASKESDKDEHLEIIVNELKALHE